MKKALCGVLMLVIGLCPGCHPPGPRPQVAGHPPGPRPQVAVFGDSLSEQAHDDYSPIMASTYDTDYHAFGGTQMSDWATQVEASTEQTVVLALGTNDAHLKPGDASNWGPVLESLVSRCVVWPVVHAPDDATKAFDVALGKVIAKYPNVKTVDWNSVAAQHPEYFLADGFHMTAAGELAYAQMLDTAAKLCQR